MHHLSQVPATQRRVRRVARGPISGGLASPCCARAPVETTLKRQQSPGRVISDVLDAAWAPKRNSVLRSLVLELLTRYRQSLCVRMRYSHTELELGISI